MTKEFRQLAYSNLGELLLRFHEANPETTGIGIDSDEDAILRANKLASEQGLSERVKFIQGSAEAVDGIFDLVIAVGATHIWGDTSSALKYLRTKISENGKILFGDGFWQTEPSAEFREIFGDLQRFTGIKDEIRRAGFTLLQSEAASIEEWDEFESNWRKGLEESGISEAQTFAAERKKEYEEGYRGILGFGYFLLST